MSSTAARLDACELLYTGLHGLLQSLMVTINQASNHSPLHARWYNLQSCS
jgi:hypothetical protein